MMLRNPLYQPVPEGKGRGWKAYDLTTGQEVNLPPLFMLENEKIGMQVHYGLCVLSEKVQYDAPYITEQGGPVLLGYYIGKDGQVYVTVVTQDRKLMGGPVKNAPRGMKKVSEDAKVAAAREAGEEISGLNAVDPIEMPGMTMNMNSALFDTVHGGSVSCWAFELTGEVVVDDEQGVRFKGGIKAVSNTLERMLGCELISLWDALELPCGMTVVAAGRLINHLRKAGKLNISVS